MISKEKFILYMETLKKFVKDWDSLDEIICVVCSDSTILYPNIAKEYTDLLADAVGDKNEWVAWYAWESDFGDFGSMEVIVDDKTYLIENAGDLYDIIQLNY